MLRLLFATIGPAGLMTFVPVTSFAETHTVNQVDLAFVPDDITISVGDTVEWIHSFDFHTVTEGTSPADTIPAPDFDEPLDPLNPIVSVTFNSPGEVPYYCLPHFFLDMIGIVRVVDPTSADEPVESSSWSGIKDLYR